MNTALKSFLQVLSCGFALLASAFRAETLSTHGRHSEKYGAEYGIDRQAASAKRLASRQRRPNARMG